MERYKILEVIGKGSWGKVYKATHKETYETVAVKKLRRDFHSWEECTNLPEVKALQKLKHPNIVELKEIVREHNELFLILEYMECDLYEKIRTQESPFLEEDIREFLSQILQGLAHMHKHGYFHRDLKPENLLVKNNVLKIADLGLAREVSSTDPYTEYVSTRWYRAPENLFRSSSYTSAIDMWAVGAILAELFIQSPIFPGESEIDQLYKICCVLGAPDWISFPYAKNVHRLVEVSSSQILPANICEVIPNASPEAIDLFKKLCSWDPLKRPTADQALQHPFFQVDLWIPLQPHYSLALTLSGKDESFEDVLPNLDLNLRESDSMPDEGALSLTLAMNSNATELRPLPAGMAHQLSQETEKDMLLDLNLSCPYQQSSDMLLDFLPCHHQQTGNMLLDLNHSSQPQQSGDMCLAFNLSCQPQQSGDMILDINHSCQPQQSVSWPFISPNEDEVYIPVDCSLSLPFSYSFQLPQIGVPQTTGCTSASMQPCGLNQTLLATPPPFQWHHYL